MAGRTLDQSAVGGLSKLTGRTKLLLGIAAIIVAAFAIDLASPHDFTAGLVLNYFAIFLSSRFKTPRAPVGIMAIVSVSALVGYFLKPDGHTDMCLLNRLLIVSIMWVMAAFACRRIVSENKWIDQRTTTENTSRFRDLFDNSGLGIQIADLDGRRLMVNKALASLLGYESVAELMAIEPKGILAPHEHDRAVSTTMKIIAEEDVPSSYEVDALHKDGSDIPLQVFWRTLEWEGEQAIHRTFIDISERKQAEAALVESEAQYRNLIEENPLGIQVIAANGRRLLANQALAEMLGYESADEILALPNRFLLPVDQQSQSLSLEELEKQATLPDFREVDLVRIDGSILSTQVIRRMVMWEGEKALQRTYIDITERKRAETAMMESERQYRDLIEKALLGMLIADQDGNRLLANNALVSLLGYDNSDEIIALPPLGIIAPHHHDWAISFAEMAETENRYARYREIDLLRKDGTTVPVQVFRRGMHWRGKKAVQLTYVDLSERKHAEEALAESEARYRDLIDGARQGILVSDQDRNRLLINQALVDMLGYDSVDELRGVQTRGFVAPYHGDRMLGFKMCEEADGDVPVSVELDLLRKDGSTLPVQAFWRVLDWGGKKVIQRTYIDISERKRAEAALLKGERRYRDLIEGSNLGIHIADHNENRLFVNLSLAKLLGYGSVEEIMQLGKYGMIAPQSRGKGRGLTDLESAKDSPPVSYEIDLLHKDGSYIPAEVYCRIIEWNGEKAIQRFIVDISERKRHEHALLERDKTVLELRRALAHASQISTMAQISSVIAHELHQPLAAIANTANAAQRRLAGGSEGNGTVLNEMLPLIAEQADRAGRVIGGIRKLFEGGQTERYVEQLDLIVDEACILATNELHGVHVDITRQYEHPAIWAMIDKVQIQQVIYNLLRNALDAIQDNPDKDITVSIAKAEDGSARISVQDNGPGLSPDVMSTLFDPFVTTKEKGMGMGLYTCQQIVESHGGRIRVESEGDSGTIVEFTLPLASEPETRTGSVH